MYILIGLSVYTFFNTVKVESNVLFSVTSVGRTNCLKFKTPIIMHYVKFTGKTARFRSLECYGLCKLALPQPRQQRHDSGIACTDLRTSTRTPRPPRCTWLPRVHSNKCTPNSPEYVILKNSSYRTVSFTVYRKYYTAQNFHFYSRS